MVVRMKTAMSTASVFLRPKRSEAMPNSGVMTIATTAAMVPSASDPEFFTCETSSI